MPVIETDCQGCAAALPLPRMAGEALGRPVLAGVGGPAAGGKSPLVPDDPRLSAGVAANVADLILRRSHRDIHFTRHAK